MLVVITCCVSGTEQDLFWAVLIIPETVKNLYIMDWNSLPAECFPSTYDLNDCKSRVNRHLLSFSS